MKLERDFADLGFYYQVSSRCGLWPSRGETFRISPTSRTLSNSTDLIPSTELPQ